MVTSPEETTRRPQENRVVRATYPSTMKIMSDGNGETKIEYVIHPDAGGAIPAWVMKSVMTSSLDHVSRVEDHFQQLRGLETLDKLDGRAMGEMVCTKSRSEKFRGKGESAAAVRLRSIFLKHRGLKEAGDKWEWLEPMLTKVAENKLQVGFEVQKKLVNLSERDGARIGEALASSLAGTKLGPVQAVDRWIKRYPALGEMDKSEIWFRPLMEAIAKRLVNEVGWAAKRRL
jgi:hypothetical protein